MDISPTWLIVAALAAWRVTHLLVREDGPADVIRRLRDALDSDLWRSLWTCFYCTSLWVALPLAAWLTTGWLERALTWLALSGAACLLERIVPSDLAPQAVYFEGDIKEDGHELLRRREPGDQSTQS